MVIVKKNAYLILIFVICVSCATGSSLVNKNIIKPGMTKLDLNWILASRTFWDQITVPTAYREYFPSQKKEILAPDKKNKDIYYVFKNVYKPVKCGWVLCNEGDGVLDKTFFNYSGAIQYVTGDVKKPKKTISIEENGKVAVIPSGSKKGTMVSDLGNLIESFKSGKISKQEFEKRKEEILSE